MDTKPIKELRDPIHGFIPVYDQEFEIIQDPVFQRLRRIKQLSFGYFVYHGAEHSRFGHVIGVMHLVERALNKIQENAKKLDLTVDIDKKDIQLARFAALLHDVGHHPFSHALDSSKMIPVKHEKYSTILVENHFSKFLEKADIKPKDVSDLILGNPPPDKPYLADLISSQIDMDRCDYLLRDSYYAGVKYGVYDLDRLIDSLIVNEEKKLVVLQKGFFSVEQFLLARYHMFSQIYLHKTKRCFENLTKIAGEHLLDIDKFDYPKPDDLKSQDGIENFITLDDSWLIKKITEITEPKMENIKKSILNRIPYTRALDSENIVPEGSMFVKSVEDDLKYGLDNHAFDEIGITNEDILFDEATQLSYKLRPFASLLAEEEPDDPKTIQIYDDETKKTKTMEDSSNIIVTLGNAIKIRRIYVRKEKKDDLMKYLKEKYPILR
ncbi:MAG: hypothetical protein COA77_01395 [Thaumarchaeota archaeon]|nr:MAG: hypothetical protein COA77_01395 [Nitrososphaerota archaeon]